MLQISVIFLILLVKFSSTQDDNCYYKHTLTKKDSTYDVRNPSYPETYSNGTTCRWKVTSPEGFNCKLKCTITLPDSPGCSTDSLLVSNTGDPQLNGAKKYCGSRSVTAVSIDTTMIIGLLASSSSTGGQFLCSFTAQPAKKKRCSCGYRKTNRIIGGVETEVNEFPMMAGVVDVDLGSFTCGAAIITPRYVLSAASCVHARKPSQLAVVVGEHDVTTGNDTTASQQFRVESLKIHPKYLTGLNVEVLGISLGLTNNAEYDYDIAIINILGNITFNIRVGPVCLPFKFINTDFSKMNVTALGWGLVEQRGKPSNVLRKVELQITSQDTCKADYPHLTDRQMCTYSPGKDFCKLDTGGHLLYLDPTNGLYISAGIISFGRFGCGSGPPGISTRVTKYIKWIEDNAPYEYCHV